MSSHLSNLYTFPILCPYFSHLLLYMSLSYQIPRLLSYTYLYSYITCKKRTTNTQSHFHCECNKGYRETCSHHPILHLVSGNRRLMIKMMIWCDDNEVFLPSYFSFFHLDKIFTKMLTSTRLWKLLKKKSLFPLLFLYALHLIPSH